MAFYKSKYTGTEIDQRLSQATYDDAVLAGFKGSKEEFDALLGKLNVIADKAENSIQMESEDLETFNKNIIEAINELHRELQAKPDEQDVIDQGELEVFKDEIAAKYTTKGETADEIQDMNSKISTLNNNLIESINEVKATADAKQPKLKAGTGIEITPENTINVTLDTTVFKVVESLPESPAAGDENKIHLVPAESTEEGNIYTEYVFVNGKWEEFGTYKSDVDLTPYLKKTDAESTYQKITDNTLATTAQTVSGAINEVHESAQELIGMTGFRQVTSVDAPVKIDNTFRAVNGKTASADDYAIYAPLSLTRGQVIAGVVTASSSVAIVSRIDGEGNWIECLVNGPDSAGIYYVAEEDMTVEICCTKQSYPNLRIYSADITKEIAKNTSDVSRLDIASTRPDVEEVDLDEGAEEGTYWHTNGTKKAEPNLNCKTVQLEKGDMLFVTGYANKNVYIIAQVNSDNTAITSTKLSVSGKENTGQVLKYSFIAAEKCAVAVSYHKAFKHEAFIVRAEVNAAVARLAGSMTALHAIYESNGAVYNEETGYWELNGLTDLTEDEMYDIYLWTNNLINQPELDNALSYAPIRTTFAPKINSIYKRANGVSINQMATFCTNLEIFNINSISDSQISLKAVGTAAHNAFAGCTNLREIRQTLYLSNETTGNIFSAAFSNCQQLRKVRIRGLKQKVSFENSPLISYESLNYIVNNAKNTAAITITVHNTTYSYLTGSAQPTEEVGGTTEEWQALVTAAQAKQISFAVPEETQSEVTE